MNLTSAEFAARLGGVLHGPSTDLTNFATDSREAGPGTAFLCIQGAQVDGHTYWPQARAQGAAVAVAEREVEEPYILVPNLVEALANLGRSWRAEWSHPVIGITGSNGKTTTKELIAASLRSRGPVLKSPGNRNTEYTSPLVWAEAAGKGIAVIEMAMRGFGQIAHLARIHQPTLGLITGIGTAHAEWPPMRLEIRERNGVTIIVDTYNASPDSTVAAIRSLREAPIAGRRLAVLGEMRELGDFSEGGHRLVGRALMESELDAVLLTGGPTKFIESEAVQAGFPPERIQSLDALAGGLGVILAGTLGLWAWATGNTPIAIAMGVLGVGFLPFLAFNRPKAKVFMGDVGALPIGALFGWAFLLLGTNAQGQIMPAAFWPLLVISIVMLIELIPVPLQIASVKLRGKRMFSFKTPVHHGFQSAGWLEPRIVAMFYVVQILVSAVGLAMFAPTRPYAPNLAAGLLLILVLSPWRWSQWAKDKVKPVEPAPQAAPGEA
ncbi:MAG: Mur ligase family protein [Armatimonadota bacterium]